MATGLQGTVGNAHIVQLIAGAITANTVAVSSVVLAIEPTVTQYYDLRALRAALGYAVNTVTIVLRSTAGSDVMTLASARVMVASADSSVGGPFGIGADATKGMLNNGAAFGETSANAIYHREVITGLASCDGIQIQLGAFGGTNTAIRVEMLVPAYNRAAAEA